MKSPRADATRLSQTDVGQISHFGPREVSRLATYSLLRCRRSAAARLKRVCGARSSVSRCRGCRGPSRSWFSVSQQACLRDGQSCSTTTNRPASNHSALVANVRSVIPLQVNDIESCQQSFRGDSWSYTTIRRRSRHDVGRRPVAVIREGRHPTHGRFRSLEQSEALDGPVEFSTGSAE